MNWKDDEEFRTWFFVLSGHGTARETEDAYVLDCAFDDYILDILCKAYQAGTQRLGDLTDDEAKALVVAMLQSQKEE